MANQSPIFIITKTSLVFSVLSIIVFTFWFLSRIINVYHFPFVGAIFELLWLPVIALTLILPILALIEWRKEKFNFRSFNLYSIIILILTIFMTI
jgi:hypothetical protein